MTVDLNFLLNIRCPYCKKPTVIAVSGFAGALCVRHKCCKFCKKEFSVEILTEVSKEKEAEDIDISGLKMRIKFLNKQRKKSYAELLIKYEAAKKINEEAMEMAREMRRKRKMN